MTDIECTYTPTCAMVRAVTEDGEDWLHDNVGDGSEVWLGDSLTVDHSCLADIVFGARADGLQVDTTN